MLVLIVVLGPPGADESAQANRPTAIVAASAKRVGARSEQNRRQTFEERRVAFNEGRHPWQPTTWHRRWLKRSSSEHTPARRNPMDDGPTSHQQS